MKNLFRIFAVVAGIAAALYSCQPKNNDAQGSAEDSLTKAEAPVQDSVGTSNDTTSTMQGDSANASK